MEEKSLSAMVKDVEAQVRAILRDRDVRSLPEGPRRVVEQLTQNLSDVRVYATDFELSEVDEDRQKNARVATKRLTAVQRRIITASQYDLFEPVDVAHLSAQIEQIITRMK